MPLPEEEEDEEDNQEDEERRRRRCWYDSVLILRGAPRDATRQVLADMRGSPWAATTHL